MQQWYQLFAIPITLFIKIKTTLYYSKVTDTAVDEPGNNGWSAIGINLNVVWRGKFFKSSVSMDDYFKQKGLHIGSISGWGASSYSPCYSLLVPLNPNLL